MKNTILALSILAVMTWVLIPSSHAQNQTGPGGNAADGTYVKQKGPPPKVKPKTK